MKRTIHALALGAALALAATSASAAEKVLWLLTPENAETQAISLILSNEVQSDGHAVRVSAQ